jgi:hypothetical protein
MPNSGGIEKMKLNEIKKIARKRGIDTKIGRSKQDIIRDIQISEGYSPCFGTKGACETKCLWKEDCVNN